MRVSSLRISQSSAGDENKQFEIIKIIIFLLFSSGLTSSRFCEVTTFPYNFGASPESFHFFPSDRPASLLYLLLLYFLYS